MKRILSAVILIPASLLVVIFAPPFFYFLGIGFIGTLCLYEYFRMMRAMGIGARPWFAYITFWILLVVFHLDSFPVLPVLALTVIVSFVLAIWRRRMPVRDRVSVLTAELLGIFYISLFLYPAIPIRYAFGDITGLHWTLLLLMVTWGGDTFALIAGKLVGSRPFAPVLSPKKTKEGALAGFLAGIVIAIALQHFLFTDLPLGHAICVSILLGIFGQIGDLAESMLKRASGIKDSSQLIPGHGGVLDRMDSLLFCFPVLYGYLLALYG